MNMTAMTTVYSSVGFFFMFTLVRFFAGFYFDAQKDRLSGCK